MHKNLTNIQKIRPEIYLAIGLLAAVFDCTALGHTAILKALTCLDTDPKTGGLSRVLDLVIFVSILKY